MVLSNTFRKIRKLSELGSICVELVDEKPALRAQNDYRLLRSKRLVSNCGRECKEDRLQLRAPYH